MGQKSMFGDKLGLNQGHRERWSRQAWGAKGSEHLTTQWCPLSPAEEARAATDEGWAGALGTLVLGWCL